MVWKQLTKCEKGCCRSKVMRSLFESYIDLLFESNCVW